MPRFNDFYDTIDDIVKHIRTDFIGPTDENEIIEVETPLSRYSLGILWAQPKNQSIENVEVTNSMEELFEDESENNEQIKNASIFKPSSMGISFSARCGDELKICFSYAV